MTSTIFSVQLLRGIAAALVLLTHVRLEVGLPPFGGAGVDLFFVISGFIIFHVTQKDAGNFLLKRVIRVVPLYWLATFFVAAIAIAAPSLLKNADFSMHHLLLSLFFVPHWTEAQQFQPLLALGWTLNFEMMFYVLFAIGMAISHRFRFEISAALVLALLAATSFVTPDSPIYGAKFYHSSLMLEFILGMAIAKYLPRLQALVTTSREEVMLIGSFAAFIAITALEPSGLRVIDFGLAAGALLCAFVLSEAAFKRANWLQGIARVSGDISYSLYLLHIYVLAAISRLLGVDGPTLWVLCFTVIPVAAWVVFNLVELPATRTLRKLLLPGKKETAAAA